MKSRFVLLASLTALLVGSAGCDWLFAFDETPPTCSITSPADSSVVSGTELIVAAAYDSVGVSHVDFYVNAELLAVDSSAPYQANWPTASLASGSWHELHCTAYDLAGNSATSDKVHVEVADYGQRGVFHGQLDINSGFYAWVGFAGLATDTLSGDVQVTSGQTLGAFLWLSRDGFAAFRSSGSYTPLFRQDNFAVCSLRTVLPASDSFYLVFWNNQTGARTVWARFVLE